MVDHDGEDIASKVQVNLLEERNSKADLGGFNSDKEWVEYIDKWY